MPIIHSDPAAWRKFRKELKGSLGFVPTMGHLHEGHLDLCRRAAAENDHVVVSIFVNPTQFNQDSDYQAYQRQLEKDAALLDQAGIGHVFAPEAKDMYPDHYEVRVSEIVDAEELEGKFRPGHFNGMLTVVLKLLNIIAADKAYFGEKDFQQLLLIRKMAKAFFLPTEIIAVPTRREADGLAMSSRNSRLTPGQREKAVMIIDTLRHVADDGEAFKKLEANGFRPEYIERKWGRRLLAAWLDDVRLIDNIDDEGK